jgi:hypothetical protein
MTTTSASGKLLREKVEHNFTHHAPTGDKAETHQMVRESGKVFAHALLASCPESPELSTALAKIEEAVMWANAAIAREE